MSLANKHLVIGVTGGIAAYKVCELVRRLQDHGATCQVVMTDAATQFVTPLTFQALSGREVYVSAWDNRIPNHMPHIDLSRQADAILIAPATADVMAKIAHGQADDLLTTLCLARDIPLLVAPAMNRQMWQNPATQRNVALLQADGVQILGPGSGEQACGEVGDGRMLEPAELLAELTAFFQPKVLAGKRVLLTAGPTFEPIDPVRGITNRSSGKMGFSLAQAAWEAGAEVTVIAGPSSVPTPRGVRRINVQRAVEMLAAVEAALHAGTAPDGSACTTDVFIAVAAVADWRVANIATSKLKKGDDAKPPPLEFTENPDILKTIASRPDAPYCVGFAAESDNLAKHAREKRERKGVPLLVGNIGPETFGKDDNELMLCDELGTQMLPRGDKLTLARLLVAEIARRLQARHT